MSDFISAFEVVFSEFQPIFDYFIPVIFFIITIRMVFFVCNNFVFYPSASSDEDSGDDYNCYLGNISQCPYSCKKYNEAFCEKYCMHCDDGGTYD